MAALPRNRNAPEQTRWELMMSTTAKVIACGPSTAVLTSAAVSDVGVKRKLNEDSFLAEAPIFLVADGMGGHRHGDLASQAVAKTFADSISAGQVTSVADVLNALEKSNRAVQALTEPSNGEGSIAGTTVAGLALVTSGDGSSLHWMAFNVGDSRVYSWEESLHQLTVDHSAVQELIDSGTISRAEAERHPERNVVTRAVGVDDEVDADVWLIPAGGRQVFLICSDGLTKELSDDRISQIVEDAVTNETLDRLASQLVSEAIESGGLDNITVVVVESVTNRQADCATSAVSAELPAFLEQTQPRV